MKPLIKEFAIASFVWVSILVFFQLSVYFYYACLFGFDTGYKIVYYAKKTIDEVGRKYALKYLLLHTVALVLIGVRHIIRAFQ